MDAHQAYCLNFLSLTERWGRGSVAIAAAWGLSVFGITLSVAAAWLIGKLLSTGPMPVNLKELSEIELWVAMVATVLNYLRLFRFVFAAAASRERSTALCYRGRGRAVFALVALLGPAAVVLLIVALTN